MKKKMIKEIAFLAVLGAIVLIVPLFIFFLLPPLMLSLWATGLFTLLFMKHRDPEVVENKKYQLFEKFLYFQIINWAFAGFFFFAELALMVFIIIIVFVVLALNKEKRTSEKFVKWLTYVVLHFFSLTVILLLGQRFPEMGEPAIVVIPMITMFNGVTAAFYMKTVKLMPKGGKRMLTLAIFLFMMLGTIVSLFPQESGIPLMQVIFGGGS
ncbi:MAG: hypothetical protein FWE07_09325 [Turicibacter sp.]|nr:hypothetical protein [Turicibacter sp.]